jgi:hypothetical protein
MTTTSSSRGLRGLRGLRLAAAAAAGFLALALPSQAQTYCDKGKPPGWSIGTTGMTVRNWTSSGLTPGSWACTTVLRTHPSLAFKIEWNVWNYGFVHRMGREGMNKNINNLNLNAQATYTMRLENLGDRGGVLAGMYGWIWGNSHADHNNPHTEIYIIENWFGGDRGNAFRTDAKKVGTVQIDGGWYDLYYRKGDGTEEKPYQWWSIRQTKRPATTVPNGTLSSGTISYAKHIKEFKDRTPWEGRVIGTNLGWLGFFAEPQYFIASSHGRVTYDPFTIDLP